MKNVQVINEMNDKMKTLFSEAKEIIVNLQNENEALKRSFIEKDNLISKLKQKNLELETEIEKMKNSNIQ